MANRPHKREIKHSGIKPNVRFTVFHRTEGSHVPWTNFRWTHFIIRNEIIKGEHKVRPPQFPAGESNQREPLRSISVMQKAIMRMSCHNHLEFVDQFPPSFERCWAILGSIGGSTATHASCRLRPKEHHAERILCLLLKVHGCRHRAKHQHHLKALSPRLPRPRRAWLQMLPNIENKEMLEMRRTIYI